MWAWPFGKDKVNIMGVKVDEKRLRRVGIVGDVEVLGVMPQGPKPPGVLLRYPRTGEAFAFSMHDAMALAFYIDLFAKELGAKQ